MSKSIKSFIAKFSPPILLILTTFAFSSRIDLFESFSKFSSRHENFQLDEIIMIFVALALYFMVLSFRQARILKQRNRVINDSLIEKTLLLKENYHRQKNNLNIIISLLEMEKNGTLFVITFKLERKVYE